MAGQEQMESLLIDAVRQLQDEGFAAAEIASVMAGLGIGIMAAIDGPDVAMGVLNRVRALVPARKWLIQ